MNEQSIATSECADNPEILCVALEHWLRRSTVRPGWFMGENYEVDCAVDIPFGGRKLPARRCSVSAGTPVCPRVSAVGSGRNGGVAGSMALSGVEVATLVADRSQHPRPRQFMEAATGSCLM